MVRDHDALGTGVGRGDRIFGLENPLDDERARPLAAEPLDVLPRHGGVELCVDPGPELLDVLRAGDVRRQVAKNERAAA